MIAQWLAVVGAIGLTIALHASTAVGLRANYRLSHRTSSALGVIPHPRASATATDLRPCSQTSSEKTKGTGTEPLQTCYFDPRRLCTRSAICSVDDRPCTANRAYFDHVYAQPPQEQPPHTQQPSLEAPDDKAEEGLKGEDDDLNRLQIKAHPVEGHIVEDERTQKRNADASSSPEHSQQEPQHQRQQHQQMLKRTLPTFFFYFPECTDSPRERPETVYRPTQTAMYSNARRSATSARPNRQSNRPNTLLDIIFDTAGTSTRRFSLFGDTPQRDELGVTRVSSILDTLPFRRDADWLRARDQDPTWRLRYMHLSPDERRRRRQRLFRLANVLDELLPDPAQVLDD